MKKVILAIFLMILSLTIQINCFGKDTTTLKNINITELPDSIELNVDSEEPVPYSVINYSDGSKGIKFVNANITTGNNNNNIKITKKVDIEDASLIHDNQNSVELKLSGNSNLSDKKINVHNNISKSGVIIIEPEKENTNDSNSISTNLPQLNFTLPPKKFANKNFDRIKPERSEEKVPISMYTVKQDESRTTTNVDQQNKTEKIKDILNIDKSSDTETPSYNPYESEPDLSGYSSKREIAQNNVQDPLNNSSNTSNSPSTTNNDLFTSIKDFISKNIFAVVGGFGCCGVIFVILILVFAGIAKSAQNQGNQGNLTQDQMNTNFTGSNVIDNDPVNYIPPKTESSSQSVSDAISKIIDIKNNKDKS